MVLGIISVKIRHLAEKKKANSTLPPRRSAAVPSGDWGRFVQVSYKTKQQPQGLLLCFGAENETRTRDPDRDSCIIGEQGGNFFFEFR